jgi:hypothetical protein
MQSVVFWGCRTDFGGVANVVQDLKPAPFKKVMRV